MSIFIARQPIFDRFQNVFGYELLYRSGNENYFPEIDGSQATAELLVNSLITTGLDTITRGKKAFINFTGNLLDKEIALLFPSDSLGIEILESVEYSERIMDVCAGLKDKGYTLVLDDFSMQPELIPLLKFADIIGICKS